MRVRVRGPTMSSGAPYNHPLRTNTTLSPAQPGNQPRPGSGYHVNAVPGSAGNTSAAAAPPSVPAQWPAAHAAKATRPTDRGSLHVDTAHAANAHAADTASAILQDSMDDLSATPVAQRRSCDLGSQHPGDSSLVFAMSEDSELKGLAGLPAPHAASSMKGRHARGPESMPPNTAADSAGATAPGGARRISQPLGRQPGRISGSAVGAEVPVPHHHQALHAHRQDGDAGAATRFQPHTPSVHRDANSAGAPATSAATAASKPSVHVANLHAHHQQKQQPQQCAGSIYRSSPHELRTPPALHVCPGSVPGRDAVVAAPTTADAGAYQPPPSASGARGKWVPQPARQVPSVSLYPSTGGGGAGSAALAGSGSSRSTPATAAMPHPVLRSDSVGPLPSTSAGASNCPDARSQYSGTPPLAPASQPLDKNFTPAQRQAVLEEVQQELYLNYTAVGVPAALINTGDTEERRRRLEQRRKQIVYGKETEGYAKYTTLIPRPCDREFHNPLHAVTPRPEYDCSKRQFDRVLNAWRRQLHLWDDCDMDALADRFLPLGKATLLELGLNVPPASSCTPTGAGAAAAVAASTSSGAPPPPPSQTPPIGVMHSIANVAAMANGDHVDDEATQSHSRSPVFADNSPTSGLYSSASLSMRLNSGRAVSLGTACTPSRPQPSDGAEGPQVDESFFLHMNSSNSRLASPFHPVYPTYTGVGHAGGRASASSQYQHLMHRNSAVYAQHHGGTPGSTYATGMVLTPSHRPASRGGMPPHHHITSIFGSEYELMAPPSGPASPAGMLHNPRAGCSPYPLAEPWVTTRRSPTCTVGLTNGVGHHQHSAATLSGVTTANGSGTMMMVSGGAGAVAGGRGESPPQRSELTLIPSTSQSNGSGFAQSPYGYRVHSPDQPYGASATTASTGTGAASTATQAQGAYATPLSRQQSRPSLGGSMNAALATPATQPQPAATSPSGTPVGLPHPLPPPVPLQQQQQQQRVAIAARVHRGSGVSGVPTTWTPPNAQAQLRVSPQTPNLHAAATPPSHKRPST